MHRLHTKAVDLHRGDLKKGENTWKKKKRPKEANVGPNVFRRRRVFASLQPLEDLKFGVIMQKKASLRSHDGWFYRPHCVLDIFSGSHNFSDGI